MQVESKVDFLMSAWSSPGVTMVGDNVLVVIRGHDHAQPTYSVEPAGQVELLSYNC